MFLYFILNNRFALICIDVFLELYWQILIEWFMFQKRKNCLPPSPLQPYEPSGIILIKYTLSWEYP